jgi:hypothetical protein
MTATYQRPVNQFVAFSGGIDSTALALLMPEATPVFTDTGWEFDELYQHIERFEEVTGREVKRIKWESFPGGLPEYIRWQNFMPNHGARYCTRLFKIEPLNKFLAKQRPVELCIGLRADEQHRPGNLTEMVGLTIRYPLQEMGLGRLDCVKVCMEHDLLPRYPVYMARGGCKGCFYKRKSEVQAMAALVPDVLDELRELEEGVQDERGRFFVMFPNVNMPIAAVQAQGTLFEASEVWADAAHREDYGDNCGLFCHR